jgi:hypothetical protein
MRAINIFNEISQRNPRGDIFVGITAAVIALPMALAFGVASGAGAEAGLYGAVRVGLFGGSPALISEPTGPIPKHNMVEDRLTAMKYAVYGGRTQVQASGTPIEGLYSAA